MAGLPGEPSDWATNGRVTETLDRYAATHGGLAPIVVMVDPLGGSTTNTLCSNTAKGNVATYLERDVPAWLRAHLDAVPGKKSWAIGGVSNGATCALQVVARAPSVYGTALVLSGEAEPTLGKNRDTVNDGFGGSQAAFNANNPAALFAAAAAQKSPAYKNLSIRFSVGKADAYTGAETAEKLAQQARSAGTDAHVRVLPGTHSWATWAAAFEAELPSLADQMLRRPA